MADSVTSIPVFTLADLKTADAGANVIGSVTDGDADSVVVRDRWNAVATVAVSDAPGDGGDGNDRALYVQKSHNNVWRRQGAQIGTFTGNEDGPYIVVPE
jgi:hypothetical protein